MWQVKRFNELTVTDLYQLLALRAQVFVVDQQRVYQDPNGRVAASNKVRGQGFGGQLLDKIMQTIQQEFPGRQIEIEAQVQVEDFYKRVGFVSEGEPFIYKSTPHIKMVHEPM